jgi:GNAT superfamily N-acetyltransferase
MLSVLLVLKINCVKKSNLGNMPSFSIKQASPDDIPIIIRIQEQTWEPTYGEILSIEQVRFMFDKIYSPDALLEQMTDGNQKFVLLFNEEVPGGFASVEQFAPDLFKMHKIYILPSFQGTGAGKYLLACVEEFVRSLGGTTLSLNVNRFNRAKSFYEKMGFSVVREEDIPIGPYWMNDFVLQKRLL